MQLLHSRPPHKFMGCKASFEKSKFVVLPVPYDGTTSYKPGTRDGPRAIIDASRYVEEYDIELDGVFTGEGIYTLSELDVDAGSPENTVKRVEEAVSEIVESRKIPITLGGEQSISSGAFSAVKKAHGNVSVLQIDAHSDLRNEFEGTKFSHASVMRRIRGKTDSVVQVGIRSMCKEEKEYIDKNKLSGSIFGSGFEADEVVGKLGEKVYISIDLDGFDPSEVPAVGTPEPGGLLWKQVIPLLKKVAQEKEIVGFDVVELCPLPGEARSDFLAAKLVYKLIGYISSSK